ncbi:MAG: glycosyltransferase family 2 protein [Gammaproteobacteria bacterium]|nr:glycosyltransferase family 2 protein [Gammaproteobacteria bacterium]NNF60522.1 glycosyltransferase family 2 protein [Gammaproteobacteria bacterium]NNM20296.1 glycosyltransferase family 2 protein [Gammaproteobacteria bacterium]
MANTTTPFLSVIAPLYNEELNVGRLHEAIVAALDHSRFAGHYELVFVDDGSTDATYARLEELAAIDPQVKVVRFRRNYGQTPAMAAGIDHASGKILVTMDGDLQNDPRDIEKLVSCVETDADIAVGWRFDRQDKLITRKVPSRIANWIIGKVTGVPIKDNGCSLKAYRSSVIKKVPLYSDMHRFIPALSSITGARITECKVRHNAREFGESKYGLSRVYKVIFDLLSIKMITAFAFQPLLWFSLLALPFVLLVLASLAWVTAIWSSGAGASIVLPSGVLIVSLSAAVFLVVCGVISELITRSSGRRPGDMAILTALDSAAEK